MDTPGPPPIAAPRRPPDRAFGRALPSPEEPAGRAATHPAAHARRGAHPTTRAVRSRCGAASARRLGPRRLAVAALAAGALAAACQRTPPAAREVRRVVSLTPSATELMAALGEAPRLVGVDEYSTYPPEVAGLPRVGSFLAPNLERVIGLTPDLVIADDVHGEALAALRDAGVATLTCRMHAVADVRACLGRLATALGREEAGAAAVAALDAAVAQARTAHPAQPPRVLAVIDREPGGLGGLVATGPGSWMDELLALAGARNVLAGAGVPYPKISPEEVLRLSPDVILDASFAVDPAAPAAAWASLPSVAAVATGRVYALREPYYLSPSPRVAPALAGLTRLLHGAAPGR